MFGRGSSNTFMRLFYGGDSRYLFGNGETNITETAINWSADVWNAIRLDMTRSRPDIIIDVYYKLNCGSVRPSTDISSWSNQASLQNITFSSISSHNIVDMFLLAKKTINTFSQQQQFDDLEIVSY